MKKIFCIGLGKLGLIFSHILADQGYKVWGFDSDPEIENNINKNIKTQEPKLNFLIKKNRKNFFFTKDIKKAVQESTYTFIIVPTPSKKNNEFDNKYIIKSLDNICSYLKNKKNYIINITSTVNPGSCNYFVKYIESKFKIKHGEQFILTYNPHLIALGSIYENVINSDLVLIGSDLAKGHILLKLLYKKIYKKKINKLKFLNLREAEIAKISINSFVTMKISFTNTISQIADVENKIDTSKILNAIGADKRIGNKYLELGALFSGPCFPRDNLNFTHYLKKKKLKSYIPEAIDNTNNSQITRYINFFYKYKKYLKKKIIIGICGLNYKENTNLAEKSPGEQLFNYYKKKYSIIVYDEIRPLTNYKFEYTDDIKYFFNKTNFIFICYKNKKFKKLENLKSKTKKVIIDMWNYTNFKQKNVILKRIGVNE
jgi:UDPglucose 6-dehydrogenase